MRGLSDGLVTTASELYSAAEDEPVDLVAQLGGKAKQRRMLVRGVTARQLDRVTAINTLVVLKSPVTLQDAREKCLTCSLDI